MVSLGLGIVFSAGAAAAFNPCGIARFCGRTGEISCIRGRHGRRCHPDLDCRRHIQTSGTKFHQERDSGHESNFSHSHDGIRHFPDCKMVAVLIGF